MSDKRTTPSGWRYTARGVLKAVLIAAGVVGFGTAYAVGCGPSEPTERERFDWQACVGGRPAIPATIHDCVAQMRAHDLASIWEEPQETVRFAGEMGFKHAPDTLPPDTLKLSNLDSDLVVMDHTGIIATIEFRYGRAVCHGDVEAAEEALTRARDVIVEGKTR